MPGGNPYHDARGRFTTASGVGSRATGDKAPAYGRGKPSKQVQRSRIERLRKQRQQEYVDNPRGESPSRDFTIRGSMRLSKAQRLQQIKRGASLPKVSADDLQAARRDLDLRIETALSFDRGAAKTKPFKVLSKRYMAVRSHLVREALRE